MNIVRNGVANPCQRGNNCAVPTDDSNRCTPGQLRRARRRIRIQQRAFTFPTFPFQPFRFQPFTPFPAFRPPRFFNNPFGNNPFNVFGKR